MAATSRGIDVSEFQGTQNWRALVQGGLTFAMAKATEGEHTSDARFGDHIEGMKSAGLLPGAYHFGWPTQDAAAEAAHFVSVVRPHLVPGFTLWLDLERRTDGANYAGRTSGQIRAWAEAWISHVKAALPGHRVGVYTSADDIKTGRMPTNADALWYPAYPAGQLGYAQAEQRAQPRPSGLTPLVWQFADAPTDRSIAYMTPAQLRAWAGHQEDDSMPTPQDYAKAVVAELQAAGAPLAAIDNPTTTDDKTVSWRGLLWDTGKNAGQANANTRALIAQVAALTAAVGSLAKGIADPAQIKAAAEEGARVALAESVVHVEVTGAPAQSAAPAAG